MQDKKYTTIIAFIALTLIAILCVAYTLYKKNNVELDSELTKQKKSDSVIELVYNNNPSKLRKNLIESFQQKDLDSQKFYLYWLYYRYYSNLNIRETFDLIENNSELSFLKEAERFYPNLFVKLKNRETLSRNEKELMNLSYGEIMLKNGYYDIALVGSMSNDYLSLSLKMSDELKDIYTKKSLSHYQYLIDEIKKSNYTKDNIKTIKNIDIHNLLIGLNMYILLDTAMESLNIKRETLNTEELYILAKNIISENYTELERLESATDLFFAMNIAVKQDKSLFEKYNINKLLSGVMEDNNINGNVIISKRGHNVIYSEQIIKALMNNSEIFKQWLISKNPDWSNI